MSGIKAPDKSSNVILKYQVAKPPCGIIALGVIRMFGFSSFLL